AVLAVLSCVATASGAQTAYPKGPVTLVVPFAPGGSTAVIGRLLAERLAVARKQPVGVENRSGAGGNIAADYVAKSNPDGNT
ncbi:tripartite tricarboxylate transporter substrate binding protein, partial [Paenibacillus polymyxa]|nr:tripartite tricarboxylate transporter substrate binding protein [Paenibacillus polymyxa]